jgi:hypothetical protein
MISPRDCTFAGTRLGQDPRLFTKDQRCPETISQRPETQFKRQRPSKMPWKDVRCQRRNCSFTDASRNEAERKKKNSPSKSREDTGVALSAQSSFSYMSRVSIRYVCNPIVPLHQLYSRSRRPDLRALPLEVIKRYAADNRNSAVCSGAGGIKILTGFRIG